MEDLARKQLETGGEIQRIISNYKKDSPGRKTTIKYYDDRLRQLDEQYTNFENTDTEIRSLENPPMDHKYFATDYYEEITTLTLQYQNQFRQKISELSLQQSNPESSGSKSSCRQQKPVTEPNDDLKRMIRRQGALIDSLTRTLDNLKPNSDNQFYNAHSQDIGKLWQEITEAHHSLYENCEDPLSIGYNVEKYITCENRMFSIRAQLSTQGQEAQSSTQSHSSLSEEPLKLPSIQIPKFDGDYLTWRPFYDLFTQLVHNQPISKTHKMWYLKTNIIGEAEKLIRHIAATDDNYDTAWTMLQDRYNNIRLISSSIIQRLLGQSFNSSSVASIKNFHDTTLECLMSLDNLGVVTSSWDPLLMHLFLKKLDRPSHILYEQSLKNPRELPTLKGFLSFLEIQFQSLEAVNNKDKQGQYRTTALSTQSSNQGCIICKGESHPLFSCNGFLKLNAEERFQTVKSHKLCINCLKGGHLTKNCTSRKCTYCNKAHNTLLHFESQENSGVSFGDTSITESAPVSLSASKAPVHNHYVMLSTVRVRLVANNGHEQEFRAILDSGSQVNLVTERLVKQLGIQPEHNTISIEGIGLSRQNCRHRVNLTLHSTLNGFATNLEAFVLPTIVSEQPAMQINVSTWPIPKNIPLADPNFNQPGHIDVLLGAEFFYQVLSIGQIKLSDHLPTLQNTVFGWVVSGKMDEIQNRSATCCVFSEYDDTTNALLERFLKFDDHASAYTAMKKQCETHFAHKRHIQRIAPLHTKDNMKISQTEEQPPEIPCKKLKTPSVNLTTALLLTMFMIPLAWASAITNTEFDSNLGMHFEGIGSIKLSKTDWQLIVYYDLNPFWEKVRSFSNGTQALGQICEELKQEMSCGQILNFMHHIEEELSWENSFLQTKRPKRGAVNILGNIANSLFGILDSEYAQQMSITIESVKENENHLQRLLKNQTSLLDATINVIKQDQTSVNEKFKSIDVQTNEIQLSMHELESFEYQSKMFQIFMSLAMELTITATNLQRIKSSILDVLTDTHHGKISPNLLSPDQLYAELIKVRNYLPASLQIPVDHDNYLQLYKIMTVEGGVTQSHIIFKILIPLCDQEPFDLYKLIPVPTTINNSLVAIKPCNDILAINAHKDQYIPISSTLLSSCTITRANTYLCSNVQSRYQKGSQICSCEIQLINNNTNLSCNIERLATNTTWTQLSNGNQWMYAFNLPRRISAVCSKRSQQLTLKGSGILTLEPQCVIKDNFITVTGHQSYISSSYESYTGLGKLGDVVKPKHLESLFHETHPYTSNTQVQRLSELQKTLALQESLDLPAKIQNINYHYSIVSYSALALSIGVVICIIWRIKSRQFNIRTPASEAPCPRPRERSTTSDFAVTVT